MVGTPVSGLLVPSPSGGVTPRDYLYMAVIVGALMIASCVTVLWARMEVMIERAGGRWKWQWGL